MILMLRVDHRLLHGQIAYSWTNYLNANCILIANDGIMKDELKKQLFIWQNHLQQSWS